MLQNQSISYLSTSLGEKKQGGKQLPYHYFSGEEAKISRIDHSLESVKYLNFDDDIYGIRINEFQAYVKE